MGVLTNYEPKNVLKFFEDICSIPHGSYNVGQISDYLTKFATDRGLKVRQDETKNVIIWKDGTEGYEDSAPVIIQGHMDMVAVKEPGCDKNLETEGLDVRVDGDLVSAEGTSLGGDDGIAVAYALALLDSDDIPHPPIEAIFTVDEEVGMDGAFAIDVSDLKGRLFLNIDSEIEGIFTVSCAGGSMSECVLPYEKETVEGTVIKLHLDQLKGGHSGIEIHKGRLNANVALGRILYGAECEGFHIISISGGDKANAITTFADATVVVNADDVDATVETMKSIYQTIKDEYATVDPDFAMTVEVGETGEVEALTELSTAAALTALVSLPNGVIRMNPDMDDMVQTSLNLGVLVTTDEAISYFFAVRSSSSTEKENVHDKLRCLIEFLGGELKVSGNYPGWEYRPDSVLRDTLVEAYREMYGKDPEVVGIHAGLECGLFSDKLPGLDCVSIGPDMQNIHTTSETLSIASTARTWELIKLTLQKLK